VIWSFLDYSRWKLTFTLKWVLGTFHFNRKFLWDQTSTNWSFFFKPTFKTFNLVCFISSKFSFKMHSSRFSCKIRSVSCNQANHVDSGSAIQCIQFKFIYWNSSFFVHSNMHFLFVLIHNPACRNLRTRFSQIFPNETCHPSYVLSFSVSNWKSSNFSSLQLWNNVKKMLL